MRVCPPQIPLHVTRPGNLESGLVKQVDIAPSTGRARILGRQPENLHQRVPVIQGSKNEAG